MEVGTSIKTVTLAIYDGKDSHELVIKVDDLDFNLIGKTIDHLKYVLLTELGITRGKK